MRPVMLLFRCALGVALLAYGPLSAWAQTPSKDAPPRPLVVVLPAQADDRTMSPDVAQFAGMLQSELSAVARYADVLLISDAAANAGVKDPRVIGCNQPACALDAARAVKARYVVATQFTTVGRERVVNVRILDVEGGRLLGMQSDKAGFEDESLPPVAARASLRLAAAARLDKEPEKPMQKVEAAPPPEAVKPRKFDPPPPKPDPVTTIVVPAEQPPPPAPAPQPAPAPPPQRVETPPAPGETFLQAQTDMIPDPRKLGAGAPTVKEEGRKVNWATRVGIVLAGVILGGWAPLMIPAGIGGTTFLILRAVELRTRLQSRPHTTAEISSMVQQGRIYEVSAYGVGAAALLLFLVGVSVMITCTVVALVLP